MATNIPGPTSHIYFSQRLRLHYVDWGNAEAPPLLLVHGGRDHCRNWDWVAEALREDYHIIAPDLRGHGDSQWVLGCAYEMSDFIYDIAQLIHQTDLAPLKIIGHSLGGMISLRYSGLYPDRVKKLVAIEGLGWPPKKMAERAGKPAHERLDNWVQELRKISGRQPRRYASVEEAYQRMQQENPHLRPDQARHLTVHGVNQNEDGTYSWKFDNYSRISSPSDLTMAQLGEIWGRIDCPTLLLRGTESWAADPGEDGRLDYFKNAACADFDNAGHWLHHDRLDLFLETVRDFLGD